MTRPIPGCPRSLPSAASTLSSAACASSARTLELPDYTAAWRLHRVAWKATPRTLSSVREVEVAKTFGDVMVEDTQVVMNAMVVKWPAARCRWIRTARCMWDRDSSLDAPDTSAMTVTFKLHECFPGVRHIVADTGLQPVAQGMKVAHSPRLDGAPEAGATGRTTETAGDLDRFPGTPDTKGKTFSVNCPVPVVAPNTFTGR